MTTSNGWQRAERIALIVFVVYATVIFFWRSASMFLPWSVDGDQFQAVWQYWRYHVEGAMPPGHLMTDYAFTMHAPPAWWLLMASLSTFVSPLVAAKLLFVVAWTTSVVAIVLGVKRWTNNLFIGLAAGLLLVRNPDFTGLIAGGYARSFGPLMTIAFAGFFLAGKHRLCLLVLVISAAMYPSIVLSAGIAYGIYVVVKGPMKLRARRCAEMFVAGLLIIALGKSQDLTAPSWWGSVVTYAESKKMVAWSKVGRAPDVPMIPPRKEFHRNSRRAFNIDGPNAFPESMRDWQANYRIVAPAGVSLACLAFVLVVYGNRARRRFLVRRGSTSAAPHGTAGSDAKVVGDATSTSVATHARSEGIATADGLSLGQLASRDGASPSSASPSGIAPADARLPWQIGLIVIGSLCGYVLARLLAWKLYFPYRILTHSWPYLIYMTIPIVTWCAARIVFPRAEQRARATVLAVCLAVVPIFAWSGPGFGAGGRSYGTNDREAPLWLKLRETLPLDAIVACDRRLCDRITLFTLRRAYANKNLAHPFRPGYYQEAERRLIAMLDAIYATSLDDVVKFAETEGVTHIAVTKSALKKFDDGLFEPVKKRAKKAFNKGSTEGFALARVPRDAILFEERGVVVIDVEKLRNAVARDAPGSAPHEVAGPTPLGPDAPDVEDSERENDRE